MTVRINLKLAIKMCKIFFEVDTIRKMLHATLEKKSNINEIINKSHKDIFCLLDKCHVNFDNTIVVLLLHLLLLCDLP